MRLRGEFIIREIMDDVVAVPVGSYALEFNGMVVLNAVSKVIWECLESGSTFQDILLAVTNRFDVTQEEAAEDITDFIEQLRMVGLLQEDP